MSADDKIEKDLLEATAPKKPKETEGVDKTVDDLLKSTLSGLGIDPEKKKQILAGPAGAAKTEPPKAVPPKPPVVEKKEPPPARADVFEIKPQEKLSKVDSSSWLKEPVSKPEPPFIKPEPSIFKPELPPKKAAPKVKKDEYPDFSKKEDVFAGTYAEPEKKKSKPVVPIIAGFLVVAAAAVIFLFMGGKKEPARDARQAVTTVKRDLGPVDAGPAAATSPDISQAGLASGAATPPPIKEKTQPSEKPAAAVPAPVPERKPASETSVVPDSAGAPLVPADQSAVKVQEIKPTRTQPSAAEAAGSPAGGEAAPAKPKTTLGQLVPIADVDTTPVLVRRVEPEYPPLAFRMKAAGSVTVNALIDETGAVVRTEVLKSSGSPYGFEKASRDAVMKWRYRPAVKEGTYVKVWMPVVVTFTIQK